MGDAFAVMQQFDFAAAGGDIQATHAHLLGMEECTGKVGVMGFCLGGGLAFLAATTSRVDGRGPDAAVPYYGSALNALTLVASNDDAHGVTTSAVSSTSTRATR